MLSRFVCRDPASLFTFLLRAVFAIGVATPVAAQDEAAVARPAIGQESNAWVGFALQLGGVAHRFRNSVSSSEIATVPVDALQAVLIRPPDSSSSDFFLPAVQASVELMGPPLRGAGIRPFVHGGVAFEFPIEQDIGKEGSTGRFFITSPLSFPGTERDTDELERRVLGQGSRLSIENERYAATAGMGLAFEFGRQERAIRVRPSIEYLWERVRAKGTVNRAVLIEAADINPPVGIEDFRLIVLEDVVTEDFHALGPGLELEMDLPRKESYVLSAFLSGQAYYSIGRNEFSFSASNELGETARFDVERDPWSYRLGLGFRIRLER